MDDVDDDGVVNCGEEVLGGQALGGQAGPSRSTPGVMPVALLPHISRHLRASQANFQVGPTHSMYT